MISSLTGLLEYKELLINLVKKELKVKYKNSALGFFWSLLNPILMMLVFTFIFTMTPLKMLAVPNFPIFFLAGLLPWNFFSNTVTGATGSIVGNGPLIKKVFFPRELLPVSISLANLVNFGLELGVFLLFILGTALVEPRFWAFYKFLPYLLLLLPILWLFTVGVSLLVSALNVYFRDIQHLIGILLMVLFYSSPIIYPAPNLGKYDIAYKSNPITALVLSFKQTLYYMAPPGARLVAYALVVAVCTFIFGYFIFRRFEPAFAEEV